MHFPYMALAFAVEQGVGGSSVAPAVGDNNASDVSFRVTTLGICFPYFLHYSTLKLPNLK